MSKTNITLAVKKITDLQEELNVLLAQVPMLKMHSNHVLTRLANGFKISAGIRLETEAPKPKEEGSKLTHILGRPIEGGKRKQTAAELGPDAEVMNDLLFQAQQVIDDVKNGAIPGDVLEKHSELAIRAAANIVGLEYTATEPAKVTTQTIADIFNAIQEQEEALSQEAAALVAAQPTVDNKPAEEQTSAASEQEQGATISAELANALDLRSRWKAATKAHEEAVTAKDELANNAEATAYQKGQATQNVNRTKAIMDEAQDDLAAAVSLLKEEEQAQYAALTAE